jgi:CRP/FNR family transcriptional regulator, cyclic AMP receptor protein
MEISMITQVPKFGFEALFLRECETFRGFSSGELKKLVRAAVRISVPAHWPLIHEQTPGDACYLLLSGRVAVFSGQDQVAELGPGQLVGEVSILQGRLRSATVSSIEPTQMLRIGGEDLSRLLGELPALREAIDAAMTAHGGSPERR